MLWTWFNNKIWPFKNIYQAEIRKLSRFSWKKKNKQAMNTCKLHMYFLEVYMYIRTYN